MYANLVESWVLIEIIKSPSIFNPHFHFSSGDKDYYLNFLTFVNNSTEMCCLLVVVEIDLLVVALISKQIDPATKHKF